MSRSKLKSQLYENLLLIINKLFKFRKLAPHALKGQKLLAQGIALGNYGHKLVALSGRLADCHYTQGDALGYELLGLQPVLEPHAKLQ